MHVKSRVFGYPIRRIWIPGVGIEVPENISGRFWIDILMIFGFRYPVFLGRVSVDTRIPIPSDTDNDTFNLLRLKVIRTIFGSNNTIFIYTKNLPIKYHYKTSLKK